MKSTSSIHSSSLASTGYGIYEVTDMSALPTLQPLEPSLPLTVQLSLTIGFTVVFSFTFVLVYVQLWMIWYYRHKRLSYQSLFLFMCLIWAGLRTSLFSFYFKNCLQANKLHIAFWWVLYSLPVCLQFSMLCLLLHFFSQVVLKARAKYEPQQYNHPLHLFVGASVLLFTAVNIACAVVTRQHELTFASVPFYLIYIRVALTETMFFIYGVLLSISIFKMTKTASTQRVLEAKGTTVCKAVLAAILITVLFLSRTLYNLISICQNMKGTPHFGFDWINVTDQADAVSKLSESPAYVSFGMVLFVWEVLPISIVVIFFRVKRLSAGQLSTDFSAQSSGPRVFFFDNPHRYNSEDDLISQPNTDNVDVIGRPSYSSNSFHSSSLGRTPDSNSLCSVTPATPSQMSFPTAAYNLPNNSAVITNKKGSDYGAISGGHFIQTKINSAHGSISK